MPLNRYQMSALRSTLSSNAIREREQRARYRRIGVAAALATLSVVAIIAVLQ